MPAAVGPQSQGHSGASLRSPRRSGVYFESNCCCLICRILLGDQKFDGNARVVRWHIGSTAERCGRNLASPYLNSVRKGALRNDRSDYMNCT